MKRNYNLNFWKGYTIIELMISIVIIGILIGIMLFSISANRRKIKDTRIISDLLQIQSRAEQLFVEKGNYDNVCVSGCDNEITALFGDISNRGGTISFKKRTSAPPQYCAYSNLLSSSNKNYCIDSRGVAREEYHPEMTCKSGGAACCPRVPCLDFDRDGKVEADDQTCYSSCKSGSCTIAGYNYYKSQGDCDLNCDGFFDVADDLIMSSALNKTCP